MDYTVVIEKGPNNYSAYVLDLPGCVAVGDTPEEIREQIREAIDFHLVGLREEGIPIPEPQAVAEKVTVPARLPRFRTALRGLASR